MHPAKLSFKNEGEKKHSQINKSWEFFFFFWLADPLCRKCQRNSSAWKQLNQDGNSNPHDKNKEPGKGNVIVIITKDKQIRYFFSFILLTDFKSNCIKQYVHFLKITLKAKTKTLRKRKHNTQNRGTQCFLSLLWVSKYYS